MKGISHFVVGVAAASCFPEAVRVGAAGNPGFFILGGAFGLLPDTLDFKFLRFFHRHDIEVTPDPLRPDARMIANALAEAIHRATENGKPVDIKLNTVKLGADRWQEYTVRFDVVGKKVEVAYGPVVDTGGNPVGEQEEEPGPSASAPLLCDLRLDYLATTTIAAFDGPTFRMTPAGKNTVSPAFLPWHRRWTHSLVMCLLAALVVGALWRPLAGLVALAAGAAHVAADQLGFMGSSLFYPFCRKRTEGMKMMHSGESAANLATVWCSCAIVFWNLMRAGYSPVPVNPVTYVFYTAVVPGLAYLVWGRWRGRAKRA